jgi:hypothetical protein
MLDVRRAFLAFATLMALALPTMLAGSTPAAAQCVVSPMQGAWVNVDSATRGITRADVTVGCCDQILNGVPHCSPPDSVHLFGRCHPTDCDWGTRSGHLQNNSGTRLDLTYDQGFAIRTVRITPLSGNRLRIRIVNDFKDPNRADYTSIAIMRH